MIKLLDREKYHETIEYDGLPIISSHLLKYAYGPEGGSIQRLELELDRIKRKVERDEDEEVEVEVKHNTLGTILHRYIENPAGFIVESDDLPDEWICKVVRGVVRELDGLEDTFKAMSLDMLRSLVIKSAVNQNVQSNWKPDTIADKVIKLGGSYFAFLKENSGKVMLSPAHKEAMEGMRQGIENSPYADLLIAHKVKDGVCFFETPILRFWRGIPMKSMIDVIVVYPDKKSIQILDPKTTSSPVQKFMYYEDHVFQVDPKNSKNYILGKTIRPGPMITYKYHRQLLFYEIAVIEFLIERGYSVDETWSISFGNIAIESRKPHLIEYFPLTTEMIALAQEEIKTCMITVYKYFESKKLIEF